MARLVGVDLPRDKRIEVALTYIYGIGRTTSQKLLAQTGVDPNARVHTLGDDELVKLRDAIEEFVDNIEIDEADESFKKKDPKKSEKDKETEDE